MSLLGIVRLCFDRSSGSFVSSDLFWHSLLSSVSMEPVDQTEGQIRPKYYDVWAQTWKRRKNSVCAILSSYE